METTNYEMQTMIGTTVKVVSSGVEIKATASCLHAEKELAIHYSLTLPVTGSKSPAIHDVVRTARGTAITIPATPENVEYLGLDTVADGRRVNVLVEVSEVEYEDFLLEAPVALQTDMELEIEDGEGGEIVEYLSTLANAFGIRKDTIVEDIAALGYEARKEHRVVYEYDGEERGEALGGHWLLIVKTPHPRFDRAALSKTYFEIVRALERAN